MRRMMNTFGSVALSLAISAISLGDVIAQSSAPSKSSTNDQNTNRGVIEIALKGKKVSLDYGRPELKGRDMLGMAPDGFVWRLGMNQSTTFKTDADLMFGSEKLAKGTYSAWMKHISGDKWALVFNSEVGVWGMPGAKRENDLLEVPIAYTKSTMNVERLTIDLMNKDGNGQMIVNWGNHKLEAMFKAN
jgi:hypothetical protein